jgi:hypothetical protein
LSAYDFLDDTGDQVMSSVLPMAAPGPSPPTPGSPSLGPDEAGSSDGRGTSGHTHHQVVPSPSHSAPSAGTPPCAGSSSTQNMHAAPPVPGTTVAGPTHTGDHVHAAPPMLGTAVAGPTHPGY